jgi:hypothetical protein
MTGIFAAIGEGGWIGVVGTLGGVLAGGVVGYIATTWNDSRRRAQEIADLKASIYAEIADRAARCVNDYLNPWRNLKADTLSSERIGKFRPMDPVVFSGIAGKLGLLTAEALIAVTQFYFRLDALSQAIESLRAAYEQEEKQIDRPWDNARNAARVSMIVTRLRSCFEPALRAIESLDVPKASEFDKEVARIYPHLRNSQLPLREALKEHAPAEPA